VSETRFAARRRHGTRGRVGYFRGAVVDEAARDVMLTRSPSFAAVVAGILNGEDIAAQPVVDRSPLARYAVASHPRSPGQRVVIVADSPMRRASAFGYGTIATTEDEGLAHTVVEALNRIDPLPRARVMRGAGWW
jgi:hypothetical protein